MSTYIQEKGDRGKKSWLAWHIAPVVRKVPVVTESSSNWGKRRRWSKGQVSVRSGLRGQLG